MKMGLDMSTMYFIAEAWYMPTPTTVKCSFLTDHICSSSNKEDDWYN